MKVVVTGASGLIGRWVVERLLKEQVETIGIDIAPPVVVAPGYQHCAGNILDGPFLNSILLEHTPKIVIHLAARIDLHGRHVDDYPANIDGVRNVVAAARLAGSVRRVIYTSSQLVCRVGYIPKSDTDYCPDTPYGESKAFTERIVRETAGDGVEWVLCRPTTVWGPHMSEHYQRFLKYIQSGRYWHFTRRKLYKSYGYVGNVAWQYWKLATAPAGMVHGKTFYLADYDPISLRDYADELQRQLGGKPIPNCPYALAWLGAKAGDILNYSGWQKFPFNSRRLRNIMTEYRYDLSPTQEVCGELPYTFVEGIQATAAWFRSTNPAAAID